ncbi:hypothetical protein Pelo_9113 [Pelomyxa schiedti]|nr:hypothetical protein Pelo_9113 [Pelomyxa schiedti]
MQWPRTEVMSTHNARDQLLALAMASHPRCGAHSPARSFMSLQPLATSPLWEWCLRGSAVSFGVSAANVGQGLIYFRFAVSSALNSPVSGALKTTTCGNTDLKIQFHGALTVDRLVLSDTDCLVNGRPGSAVFVLDSESPCERRRLLWAQGIDTFVNEKWAVVCKAYGSKLAVINMAENSGSEQDVQVNWLSAAEQFDYHTVECTGVLLNKSSVDEAVVEYGTQQHLFLMVIDLGKSHATNQLVVSHFFKWNNLDCVSSFRSGIVMTKSATGQRVVFVEMRSLESVSVFEFLVEDGNDTLRPISSLASRVSQLSSSLFCISKSDASVEVWDCNNTSAPLRVLKSRYPSVIADSGFLFHLVDDVIEVTDSHGNLVCTIALPGSRTITRTLLSSSSFPKRS